MRALALLAALAAFAPASGQPLKGWQPPRPDRTVLANKLTVVSLHQPGAQMATVSAMVRAGSAADPESLSGLACFTAMMLSRGAGGWTAERIASEVDFLGADLSADCDQDASYLTLTCLSRHLDRLLPLFLELLVRPSFDSSEVEIRRREVLSSLRLREDRLRQVSEEAFDSLLYGSHPYGHPVMGRPAGVGRLAAHHIRSFHRTHYLPNMTAIAYVGPLSKNAAVSRIKKLAAGWKPGPPSGPVLPEVPLPPSPRALFVHRPVSQAYVTLGFLGPSRQDPDYQSARLMNYILGGGGFSSRLTRSIRVRHGLAYDVDSYFDPRLGPGPFRFTVQTKTASADTAVKLMLEHMRDMAGGPVSEKELREAKDYLLGSYPFRFETGQQMARQCLLLELDRLAPGYFAEDLELTSRATTGDLQASARRLLRPNGFLMVVVGDTARMRIDLPGMELERR